MTDYDTLIKPLQYKPHQENANVVDTDPNYYPEEFHSDFAKLLKTPLPNGQLVPLIKLPKEKEQSKYWKSKLNVSAFVVAGSMLIIIIMLMQETDLLKLAWSMALKGVGVQ